MNDPISTSFEDWGAPKGAVQWGNTKVAQCLAEMVEQLDPYQRTIVTEHDLKRNSKVTANAGSGKTLVLIVRALKLVVEDSVPAEKIVLITFTNKATDEIRARYEDFFRKAVGEEALREIALPHISTIHSFGKYVVNYVLDLPFQTMTKYDSFKVLGDIVADVTKMSWGKGAYTDTVMDTIRNIYANNELHFFCLPEMNKAGRLQKVHTEYRGSLLEAARNLNQFSMVKVNDRIYNRNTNWEKYVETRIAYYVKSSGLGEHQFREVIRQYVETKYTRMKMDFADMVSLPMLYTAQHPESLPRIWDRYEQFILDESQDMDLSQIALAICCDRHSYGLYSGKQPEDLSTLFRSRA